MFIRILDFNILDERNDTEAIAEARKKIAEYESAGLKVIARLREKESGSNIQISVYDDKLYRYTVRDIIRC